VRLQHGEVQACGLDWRDASSPGRVVNLRMCALSLSMLLAAGACGRHAAPPVAPHAGRAAAVPESAPAVEIRYPALPAGARSLDRALQAYAASERESFLAQVAAQAGSTGDAASPWRLHLSFRVEGDGRDFLGVLAQGEAYTGGAHGNPLLASFVWHRRSDRVLALSDLFVRPDAALQRLSTHAAAALRSRAGADAARIADGTAPRAENYAVFLIDLDAAGRACGLRLLFPAYQVAPYAAGLQQVAVPAPQFVDLLRPEFRAAFLAPKPG